MFKYQANVNSDSSLRSHNTFGIDARAKRLVTITREEELRWAIRQFQPPYLILGGGSNILLTRDVEQTILLNKILGKSIYRRFKRKVQVVVGGGENWHQFVLWTLAQGLGGLENLSLIPGSVGASPLQNIGAYGVELKDVFLKLEAIHLTSGKSRTFFKKDCQFGYRESIFKKELKGQYMVTRVYFSLTPEAVHQPNLAYGAIRETLKEMNIEQPGIRDVSEAVIRIRSSKLPDPGELGNAGSFFKNPIISKDHLRQLRSKYPDLPSYPVDEQSEKVPAAWLIERCGWKGKRVGNTGSHARQALVLVNYGNASGDEIRRLSEQIQQSVLQKFGIELQAEVNFI